MSRTYLTFGSLDGDSWKQLDPVEAGSTDQALNLARDQRPFEHYAVVPKRNWKSATPGVRERAPVVTWTPLDGGQVTIDDAIEEAKTQAKEALKSPASPSEAATQHTALDPDAL